MRPGSDGIGIFDRAGLLTREVQSCSGVKCIDTAPTREDRGRLPAMNREDPGLEITQDRGALCRLSDTGDVILVHVRVRVAGPAQEGELTLWSAIGSFIPTATRWALITGFPAVLSFGVPRKFFLRDERLVLGAVGIAPDGKKKILWQGCYRVGWATTVPQLRPVTIR